METCSKSVLITGCSTGIGHATALRLQRTGWKVYATARRPECLADLEAAGCRTLALDVNDEASMQAAVRSIEECEGAIGVLVNNAGYSQSGALETVPIGRVRAQFETNVFGLLRMCQLVLPAMRARGRGRIINLSSMGGRLTFPGGGAYHATKHAVEAISDAMRFEVGGLGIHVVLIEPGFIRTSFSSSTSREMEALPKAGPYGQFNASIEQATREVYEKPPWSWLGGDADAVARVIERACTARWPRPRYTVTPSATMLLTTRALSPDRVWDAFMRVNFPRPRQP
jgi:NAD(P)-dependent dehydrogenase (short-subunit alcohol dehydrogenase family)